MLYRSSTPRGSSPCQFNLQAKLFGALCLFVGLHGAARSTCAQTLTRELNVSSSATSPAEIIVHNASGRVTVVAGDEERKSVSLKAESPGATVAEADVQTKTEGGRVTVEVRERAERERIDLTLEVP